jgi:hypothetical protein
MIREISFNADDYIVYKHNHLDIMKMALSFYRIGGVLILEISINSRKASLPRLIIPIPQVWYTRLDW